MAWSSASAVSRELVSDPREEHVGLDEHPLGRQIDEQRPVGVGVVSHPEDLHDSTAFPQLQRVVAGHGFQHQLRRLPGQVIGHDGVRPGRELFEQVPVRLVGDDGQPFGHPPPECRPSDRSGDGC